MASDSQLLQQTAATTGSFNFNLFSTPMTFEEAANVLTTASKVKETLPIQDLDLEGGDEPTAMFKTVSTHKDHRTEGLVLQEAHEQISSQYKTTQEVFIAPIGDWTKQVYKDVSQHRQLRSCYHVGFLVLISAPIKVRPLSLVWFSLQLELGSLRLLVLWDHSGSGCYGH
eukprot:scaffold14632_cov22-Cyclotella_meneghiniana.AAC.4